MLAIATGDDTDSDSCVYWLRADTDHQGRVTAFELTRFGSGEKYHLPADLSSCDCPDHIYREERPGGCKDMAALRQALSAIITPRDEPVQDPPSAAVA